MSSHVDIHKLNAEERLALLGEIWDSLDPASIPVTDAQRAELDRRLADFEQDPDQGIPWDQVLQKIRDHDQ